MYFVGGLPLVNFQIYFLQFFLWPTLWENFVHVIQVVSTFFGGLLSPEIHGVPPKIYLTYFYGSTYIRPSNREISHLLTPSLTFFRVQNDFERQYIQQ